MPAVTGSASTRAPSSTAMAGLTYAYVAVSEIGAWWSSQMYAVNASIDPATVRYASASQDDVDTCDTTRRSPRASATTPSTAPPTSVSYTVAVNGSPGSGSLREKKEPLAQQIAATSTMPAPTGATAPAPPRESTSVARPAKPTSTPATVVRRGRSPV